MKQTLLGLTQDVLSAIDSENVSSVGETEEAGQVVLILNRAYFEIITSARWKFLRNVGSLVATAFDNTLTTPSGTVAVDPRWLWLDDAYINYVHPDSFLDLTQRRNTADSNIISENGVKTYNDREPQFFTSFDDENFIFDANDFSAANTKMIMYTIPTTRLSTDADMFTLPNQLWPTFSELCMGYAIAELKGDTQTGQQKVVNSHRQLSRQRKLATLVDLPVDLRRFGVQARRSLKASLSPPRNTGNGFIF